MASVQPIPEGFHSVTPHLCMKGAADAIEFYKKAFGAKELLRLAGPAGTIGHAEVKIGDSVIMLADEYPEMDFHGPKSLGGPPVHIYLYVADVDSIVAQASAAGAKTLSPVEDQFYGDRMGTLEDPFGHVWHVATHKEDLSTEELTARSAEMTRSAEAGG